MYWFTYFSLRFSSKSTFCRPVVGHFNYTLYFYFVSTRNSRTSAAITNRTAATDALRSSHAVEWTSCGPSHVSRKTTKRRCGYLQWVAYLYLVWCMSLLTNFVLDRYNLVLWIFLFCRVFILLCSHGSKKTAKWVIAPNAQFLNGR